MPNPNIIEETPISMSELKDELNTIKKRDGELDFRSNKMLDYLQQVPVLSKKKNGELVEDIEKLKIPRLKDVQIVKIADLLPKSVDELKVILQGYTLSVTNDNLKKIIDVVKKYN